MTVRHANLTFRMIVPNVIRQTVFGVPEFFTA
jgi:hypothetical protein